MYDLKSVKLPKLAGKALHSFTLMLENPQLRALLAIKLLRDAGIITLRRLALEELPAMLPPLPRAEAIALPASVGQAEALPRPAGLPQSSVADYGQAYRSGQATPEQVAERLLAAVAQSERREPPLRALIEVQREDLLRQARESAARWQAGQPLSPFDGVPIAIKDEFDLRGYVTGAGTSSLGERPAQTDATIVARLRQAGALLIGKANMHELGIGVSGQNTSRGTARNPYDPTRYPGGSSSGSAVAVAAGLCPLALGADAGGSIRIPAALCGVVGLKATFGRISAAGSFGLCWTMGHPGPLGASARDVALVYRRIAGADLADPTTLGQPEVAQPDLDSLDFSGLTAGIYRPWFEHANPEIVATCQALIERLQGAGMQLREISIPELDATRIAHAVTVISEIAASVARYRPRQRRQLGLEVRTNLALARALAAGDYLQAQRMRARASAHFSAAFAHCDLILTPATGRTAPPIPEGALPRGESDLSVALELMRFIFPANLTGLPAISFPAGYDRQGLPIGIQAIAPAWREDLLLRVAIAAEPLVERRPPQVLYKLLEGPSTNADPQAGTPAQRIYE